MAKKKVKKRKAGGTITKRSELAETVALLALDVMRTLGTESGESAEWLDVVALAELVAALTIRARHVGVKAVRGMRYEPGDDKADRIEENAEADAVADLLDRYRKRKEEE